MKRFVEVRDGFEFLVIDCKDPDRPVIVCRCDGFNAPLNAEYVAAALQSYHAHLMDTVLGCENADLSAQAADLLQRAVDGRAGNTWISEARMWLTDYMKIAPSDIEGAGC